MIKQIFSAYFLLITTLTFGQKSDSLSVTYIANSAYFIECEDQNILIDAVFNQCIGNYSCPDSLVINKMLCRKSPFENIDFILVTHNHPDHVNDSLLIEMLKMRDDFKLLIPQQVYTQISGKKSFLDFEDRVYNIQLDTAETTQLTIDGLRFDIARSKHALTYETENLNYIINYNHFRILHSGDVFPVSIQDIDPNFFANIDLAIVPLSFGMDRFVVHDSILSPRHTIISHIKRDFVPKFKEIIQIDTATFNRMDILFDANERITYER
jgi:L-ascorbate metabolism protein UlaG (beta-lactamase superfamily)